MTQIKTFQEMKCKFCGCTENLHICLDHSTMKKMILELQDKLSRRSMQINELKEELKRAYVRIADLTHPEYADK